ncbi:hypothetical protein FS837_010606 [Tulasnella sp. UAMH 9824]|nr:hypothetical protein FS837_010606 [Tulasnella sp. UAMH 9824]
MSRSSSVTNTNSDTVMTEAQDDEATSEDIDGTPLDTTAFDDYNLAYSNTPDGGFDIESEIEEQYSGSEFEVDSESEAESPQMVRSTRVLSVEKKKAAMKATQAVSKRHSPKRAAKAAQSSRAANRTAVSAPVKTKAPAAGGRRSDGPARRTRSSASSQQPILQIIGEGEDQMPPPKSKSRKTWLDWEKAALKSAIHNWWEAVGAAPYKNKTKIILPIHEDNGAWDWMRTECQRLESRFKRKRMPK